MSTYDEITTALFCPFCGLEQKGWQTYDLSAGGFGKYTITRAERTASTIAYKRLKSGEEECIVRLQIHTICERCSRWCAIRLDQSPYGKVSIPDKPFMPQAQGAPKED